MEQEEQESSEKEKGKRAGSFNVCFAHNSIFGSFQDRSSVTKQQDSLIEGTSTPKAAKSLGKI